MANKRLVMVIDLKRCIGCHSCAMACKVENNLPNNVWWNRVTTVGGEAMDTPAGTFPNLSMGWVTVACQHCENPQCVKVCPVGATTKRKEDGVVLQDAERCIGCRYCVSACPYTGVRQFNWQAPQHDLDFAVGAANAPVHKKGTVGKCTWCTLRLAEGKLPACVEVCPAIARHFGDLNDPNSEVSNLLRLRAHMQLMPEKGTRPSVYFLT